MSTGAATRTELLELAKELRHAVPSRAPLDVAEQVQHCIVRLESIAERDPATDEAQQACAAGRALLAECHGLRRRLRGEGDG